VEAGLVGGREVLGEAPVDDDGLAEVADDDVGGLEVAVDDVAAVGVGDGIGDGDDVVEQADALVDGGALGDELAERAAGDELHGIERGAVGPAAGLVDRDDAGVLEARGDEGLAEEADLADVGARDELLDRDVAAELAVVDAGDAAEAAAAVLADDLVALGCARLGGGGGVRGRCVVEDGGRRGARGAGARRVVRGWGVVARHCVAG
jgi:hypothetical protein